MVRSHWYWDEERWRSESRPAILALLWEEGVRDSGVAEVVEMEVLAYPMLDLSR